MDKEDYLEHAKSCGIDVTGMEAVPIEEAAGKVLAFPVTDLRDMSELYPIGHRITSGDYILLEALGYDYILTPINHGA